jgi:uncharacterized membrane protein YraQ (UPF0718 family)
MTFAALPAPSPTGDIYVAFLSIVFEGAPYILLGTLLSGVIDAFLPARLLERVLPKSRVISTFLAGLLGLVFPVCECAIVPVIRRLVQKGLPVSCAVTYMLSAPIVNPIVALSTLTAFKEFQNWSCDNDPSKAFSWLRGGCRCRLDFRPPQTLSDPPRANHR